MTSHVAMIVLLLQIFVRQPYNLSNLDLTVKVELVAQLLKPTE